MTKNSVSHIVSFANKLAVCTIETNCIVNTTRSVQYASDKSVELNRGFVRFIVTSLVFIIGEGPSFLQQQPLGFGKDFAIVL